ncbi:MAG: hypothetical protein GKR94_16725 [Gammaproteobacteria bacterium]|nr:hypothetical protein [Gammaproteobacteria bacterium]
MPKARVFIDGEPAVYNRVRERGWMPNIMQQTSIRAQVKLEFAYELCCRMAQATGSEQRPETAAMLGEIWSYAELTRAAVRAAEEESYDWGGGTWLCDARPFLALRATVPLWMARVNEIIKTIGSHNLLATPSEADFADTELAPLLDTYLTGADTDAAGRARIFRTAWDLVGSALGARLELYERYYLSSSARCFGMAHRQMGEREWCAVPAFFERLDQVFGRH